MTHLSEIQVLRFLIQFTLLFVVARILADIMKRLGQATVIGELLAGIILGQSLLGHFAPAFHQLLFPPEPLADHLLEAIAWIGVIMLLLYTGLETDLGILRSVGRAAVAISWLGMLVPLATGFALGWEIPVGYLAHPNDRLIFSLFDCCRDVHLGGAGHRKDLDRSRSDAPRLGYDHSGGWDYR